MKYQGSMARIVSLAVLFAAIISTLAVEVIDDSMSDIEHMTILPGGIKLCSQSGSSREKTFTLDDTAYIFINYTMSLSIESPCFRKKHFIKFISNRQYNQMNHKSILQIKFTKNGLVIDTDDDIEYSFKFTKNGLVIDTEDDLEYSSNIKLLNYEIRRGVDCLKRSHNMNINISKENKYSWFMDKCDLVFKRKNEEFCGIYHGFVRMDESMVLYQINRKDILFFNTLFNKPKDTKVRIVTNYCTNNLITEFNPFDFLNDEENSKSWFKFDYDVIKSGSNSSLIISIAGIPIDYMNYETVCDEEPKFSFAGVSNIKSVCNYFNQFYNPDFTHETGTRYYINFPYIIILLMILIGKAICGFAIYKRRQARLITFTSSRLVEHYGNVSPLGRGTIIVAANGAAYPRQPSNQSNDLGQPSEDLPPAYKDLQLPTDINLPRYEEAIKSPSLSPPGYEDSCRDNVGFQIESENSSLRDVTDSVEVNQLSTKDGRAVLSDLS